MKSIHEFLAESGYTDFRTVSGKLCGLQKFMFTTGLVVGLDAAGYEYRYCFENHDQALAALEAWDGIGHPQGPWIKCKGRINGKFVDMRNPALGAISDARAALKGGKA